MLRQMHHQSSQIPSCRQLVLMASLLLEGGLPFLELVAELMAAQVLRQPQRQLLVLVLVLKLVLV